ncbi:fimbrial biogenesis outer membrane usher protein [Rahnella bruchi]|uniref:fimbrial biogenesis outer membrane usher protein n=1 Tax=Rahnella bruchi TaxID=1510573 RepID=UPI0039EFD4BC
MIGLSLVFSNQVVADLPRSGFINIKGVIIPETFSRSLNNGMSLPLFLHLKEGTNTQSDQKIGNAMIWLDGDRIKIRDIKIEQSEGNASLNQQIAARLTELTNEAFDSQLTIGVNPAAHLSLDMKQLVLQLVVERNGLGTLLRSRSEDIGASSVDTVSSTLNYNLGLYNNQNRDRNSNTSSYITLDSVTALREHHVAFNGSMYGLGTNHQQSNLYKAMYERDFQGYRFAAGMLDSWNLQSLGPVTGISSGKIYGVSWGNQANSTQFDNTQSVTPVVAFLPAAGEVHILRDNRLMSVQNFAMGNHEVDTRTLPYGIYDVQVEVIVNGRTVDKRIQRINKIFSPGQSGSRAFAWQAWGGSFHMDSWGHNNHREAAKESWLAGLSFSGNVQRLNWAATGYGYDKNGLTEARLSLPVTETISVNQQNLAATDRSWSSVSSVNAALPGGFSSVWLSREKRNVGNRLRQDDSDNRAIGGTLNLNALTPVLGTLTVSYNDDQRNNSHYYTADYNQNLYTGSLGNLSVRMGVQRYNNGEYYGNTDKYISLNFSVPMGNWFSAGFSNQRGVTLANLAARKELNYGVIRGVGASLSQAVSGKNVSQENWNGNAYARFASKYSNGTASVSTGARGDVTSNLTATGAVGWQGKNLAASGYSEGNAGIIIDTGLEDDGLLSAKVNGRLFDVTGSKNYLSLAPYSRYDIELLNNKNAENSYDIVDQRKSKFTLYPGNVAVIKPGIKQLVTVFGRIRAEDGTLLTNAPVNNHIGRTVTNDKGEFVMDVDRKYPTIDFKTSGNGSCEAELNLKDAKGAIWVGDVTCVGLNSYASNETSGNNNES